MIPLFALALRVASRVVRKEKLSGLQGMGINCILV